MFSLTEDQKRRIEENRRLAREKLEKRQVPDQNGRSNGGSDEPLAKKMNLLSTGSSIPNAPSTSNGLKVPPKVIIEKKEPLERSKPLGEASVASPIRGYTPKIKVKFLIANTKEFKLTFHPYHQIMVDLLKTTKSGHFNREDKCWLIELHEHDDLLDKMKKIKELDMEFELIPLNVRKIFFSEFHNRPNNPPKIDIKKIESCLYDSLFPYQKVGVTFGLERNGRILLADEMGLGKTLQALAIARYFANEWPLLIVCPASVKFSWRQAIEKFLPQANDICVIEKGSDPIPSTRSSRTVIIMSYEQMSNKYRQLVDNKIYVVIFDESHMLKEEKTKRTKAAIELSRVAQRRILLSGTPALSRPKELYSQVRIVNPEIFTNFKLFAKRYCDAKEGKWGFQADGASNMEELGAILEKAVMIRRLKKNVLHDLPDKVRQLIYLSGSSIDTKIHSLKKAREAVEKATKGNDVAARHQTLMGYYQETGIVKAAIVADYIVDSYFYIDAPPCKLLIFAHHQIVLDTIAATLKQRRARYIRIDGRTKGPDREMFCKQFQEDEGTSAALLSITAAGTGITLHAANKVIFAELHWNPGILMQAEDRAHRVGQKDSVLVHYVLAKNTADDCIWPIIQSKLAVLQGANLNQESFGGLKNSKLFVDEHKTRISQYFAKIEEEREADDSLNDSIWVLDE